MLKSLAECKLLANFIVIEDREGVSGQDVFASFLKNCENDNSVKQINLICFENPPAFYYPCGEFKNEKTTEHNFFHDPCQWYNSSMQRQDLSLFTSNPSSLSETAFFIDSLSLLAYHQGFFRMCRDLNFLKRYSKKFVCAVHGDLFSLKDLEEIYFLCSASVRLQNISNKEKMCELMYKKPGGKIFKQKELFFISDDLKVTSKISETNNLISSDTKKDIECLTTFKLGLHISEEERKARDELVLPYMKSKVPSKAGEIIYELEADELEDDPDDDLDI